MTDTNKIKQYIPVVPPKESNQPPKQTNRKVKRTKRRHFPKPLPLFSKNTKAKSLNPDFHDNLVEKPTISTTLRELPKIPDAGTVSQYVIAKDFPVQSVLGNDKSRDFKLRDVDLTHSIRQRIKHLKKWQKDQGVKSEGVGGIGSNPSLSQRGRNLESLKSVSLLRNEEDESSEQTMKRRIKIYPFMESENGSVIEAKRLEKEMELLKKHEDELKKDIAQQNQQNAQKGL